MRKTILLFCFFITAYCSYAQTTANLVDEECYSLTLKASSLCGTETKGFIEIVGTKKYLDEFFLNTKSMHSCNILLEGKEEFYKNLKPANCLGNGVHVKFNEETDFLEVYKKMREEYAENESEICINSKGEISVSFSNKYGGVSLSTTGSISLTSKYANGASTKIDLHK